MQREFTHLIGKTFTEVYRLPDSHESNGICFLNPTEEYELYHNQSCCEHVYVEEIIGDLEDLENTPILVVEERHSDVPEDHNPGSDECREWTFYELRTIKGSCTIRFYGASNGYYGTSANLYQTKG